MKNTIVAITLLVIILSACTFRRSYSIRLVQIDSLMSLSPDSALLILENIPIQALKTKSDSAYYALLLIQARDKNFITQTDDSLIRSVVEYYDVHGNTAMQARAHYLLGSIYRDSNKHGMAVKEYLKAALLGEEIHNYELIGNIYVNAGYLYYLQDMPAKADSLFRLGERIGRCLNDTCMWVNGLLWQGKVDFRCKRYVEAEQKYLDANRALGNFGDNRTRAVVAGSLSSLYSRMGKKEKALEYARLKFFLEAGEGQDYSDFLMFGDAFYQMEQYDSAIFYINKCLDAKDLSIKAGGYTRLADIALLCGDSVESLKMERLRSIYMDSLNNLSQSNDILTTEKEVWMQQQQVRYRDFLSRYKYVLFAVIVFGCMAIYCFRKYYKCKYHKNRKVLLELQTASYRQYALFQEQLRRKEKEIELLKNKINNRYIDEKQQVILSEELQVNKGEHAALAKETLLHSPVYVKLNLIITDFKWKDKSDNVLSDNEWKQLIMGVNSYTNNLVSRVSLQYNLSPKHTCLCCLLLLNFPVTHIAYVMHCTRPTVYNSEHDILMKMGEKYEKGKLRELLNNIK